MKITCTLEEIKKDKSMALVELNADGVTVVDVPIKKVTPKKIFFHAPLYQLGVRDQVFFYEIEEQYLQIRGECTYVEEFTFFLKGAALVAKKDVESVVTYYQTKGEEYTKSVNSQLKEQLKAIKASRALEVTKEERNKSNTHTFSYSVKELKNESTMTYLEIMDSKIKEKTVIIKSISAEQIVFEEPLPGLGACLLTSSLSNQSLNVVPVEGKRGSFKFEKNLLVTEKDSYIAHDQAQGEIIRQMNDMLAALKS